MAKVYGANPPVAVRFTQGSAAPDHRSDRAEVESLRTKVGRTRGAVNGTLGDDVSLATSVAVTERFQEFESPPKRTVSGPVDERERENIAPPREFWIQSV